MAILDRTLDTIIYDRIVRNEQTAAYRLEGVSYLEVRAPRRQYEQPSLWVDGRYVGELCGDSARAAQGVRSRTFTVRGRFQHLAYLIDSVES